MNPDVDLVFKNKNMFKKSTGFLQMLLFFLDINEELPISQEKPKAIHEKITQLFKARNFFSFLRNYRNLFFSQSGCGFRIRI